MRVLALLALALASCGAESGSSAEPRNLVLVSIDSLRWDALSSTGAARETSPAIDALAAEGAVFDEVLAPTSWTLPSHVTLLTGLSIPGHRVDDTTDRIDPNRVLLAEHLAEAGYRTAGFVSAPFLHEAYGFGAGFEEYAVFGSGRGVAFPPPDASHRSSHADAPAPEVVDAALAWLARTPEQGTPWFLFVHLWDPHYDYAPPPPYDELFAGAYDSDLDVSDYEHNEALAGPLSKLDREFVRALYDGEVRWTDGHVERLFDALRARGDWPRTVSSLVSDHGEEFWEHGGRGHFRTVFEESVRVPWILVAPGRIEPVTRVAGVASLEDVAPTMLALAGAPSLVEATGTDRSRVALTGGRADGEALLSLGTIRALRGDGWKVVGDSATGLATTYDLEADPGERSPRPATAEWTRRLTERVRAEELHARGLAWDPAEPVDLDPETQELLRKLGYTD